jgi:hypothetical protein
MCVGFTVNLKLEQEQRSIPGKKIKIDSNSQKRQQVK